MSEPVNKETAATSVGQALVILGLGMVGGTWVAMEVVRD